jgi:tetratricopeptide (TPR) repeat protein
MHKLRLKTVTLVLTSSLFDLGRYEEAIRYYDKVLAIDPNNAFALSAKQLATNNLR